MFGSPFRLTVTRLLFACLLLYFFTLGLPVALAAEKGVKILVTTDVHGYVDKDAAQGHIGFAALKGYADRERQKGFITFLLDSGDMMSGSAFAQVDNGKTVARLVGLMGYSGMTPGNHAYDYNVETKDPYYFFEQLLPLVKRENPSFSATAANLSLQAGGPPPNMVNTPFILYDETRSTPEGLRIIVAGVTTPEAGKQAARYLAQPYDFNLHKEDKKTKETVLGLLEKALQEYSRPNDVVIVLAHLGWNESRTKGRKDRLTGKDIAAVPNVDFILDGHTHKKVGPEKIGDAMYAQGGRYLGHFSEIVLRQNAGKIEKGISILSERDLKDVSPSPRIADVIAQTRQQFGLDKVLFDLTDAERATFSKDNIRWRSRPIGALVTELMRRTTGSDLAICSANSFRNDFLPRQITLAQLYDVVPLAGTLMTGKIRGKNVKQFFSHYLVPGSGLFPQTSGIVVHAAQKLPGSRAPYVIRQITLEDGQPLEPEKEYTIAFNSRFMLGEAKAKLLIQDAQVYGGLVQSIADYLGRAPSLQWREFTSQKNLELDDH